MNGATPEGIDDLVGELAFGRINAGELACSYVVRTLRRVAGPRWKQGAWQPGPLACTSRWADARTVATTRLVRVDSFASRALAAWASGLRPVDLLFHVPSPAEVLALQARGRRCVSLLPEGASAGPHANGLAFAVHDLCHLEKFIDPEHHAGQVGFFEAALAARTRSPMVELEQHLDAAWHADRDRVLSDMNGSCIFLFAALKMKLKMAVRRLVAHRHGAPAPTGGPLSAVEMAAFDEALDALLDAFALHGRVREAARLISTKHDARKAAEELAACFEARGAQVLRALRRAARHDRGTAYVTCAARAATAMARHRRWRAPDACAVVR